MMIRSYAELAAPRLFDVAAIDSAIPHLINPPDYPPLLVDPFGPDFTDRADYKSASEVTRRS
jgi:hypothetical protein